MQPSEICTGGILRWPVQFRLATKHTQVFVLSQASLPHTPESRGPAHGQVLVPTIAASLETFATVHNTSDRRPVSPEDTGVPFCTLSLG